MDQQATERTTDERALARIAVWCRHEPASTFCDVIAISDGRASTACNGSWPANDEVEISDDPPLEKRCDRCVRRHVDRKFVERGLRELVANAPIDARFDVGQLDDAGDQPSVISDEWDNEERGR